MLIIIVQHFNSTTSRSFKSIGQDMIDIFAFTTIDDQQTIPLVPHPVGKTARESVLIC
jgi:hypothetical protein